MHQTPDILYKTTHLPGRTRLAAAPQKRVLDVATRKRRQQRQLEALEKDNFHDDPHAAFAHLAAKAKLPTFADGSESEPPLCQSCLVPCNQFIHCYNRYVASMNMIVLIHLYMRHQPSIRTYTNKTTVLC